MCSPSVSCTSSLRSMTLSESLSDWAGRSPFLADFLPDQHSDAYCGAIENAIRDHPGDPQIAAAFAIDATVGLFRQAWQCPACGVWLDRDVNAAVNVAKAAGLAVTACGAQVRPGAPPLAQRGEAGTRPKSRRQAA